jgi:LPXTG-motif cell wall-anchored protein
MKPNLVEYEKIFKKKSEPVIINKNIEIKQTNNYYFFFNILGLVIIVGGGFLLYNRKRNKEKNKRMYTQKVIQFYHDTNKFEK